MLYTEASLEAVIAGDAFTNNSIAHRPLPFPINIVAEMRLLWRVIVRGFVGVITESSVHAYRSQVAMNCQF